MIDASRGKLGRIIRFSHEHTFKARRVVLRLFIPMLFVCIVDLYGINFGFR